jgi:hypothetical protein
MVNIKKYLSEQEGLAAALSKKMGKGNDHVKRVWKRVELLKAEIQEAENPQEEEDVPMQEEKHE